MCGAAGCCAGRRDGGPAPVDVGRHHDRLRGPEAWDGLVELFRRPLFLAFDVLLVLGLAFHGVNGLRVALVGSGLLVDRHKALLVAALLLVGLVGLVAAVRTFA
jgi:succinate dehydrogenase / fumarate reductase cytochrome b subunit